MLIEVSRPIRARFSNGVIHLVPGVPTELPDEQARRLLTKAPNDVRVVGSEPTAPPAEPTPAPGVDAILSMPLAEFVTRRLALKVKLPDGVTCWFVSGATEVAVLRSEGVPRGDIWTAAELASVIGGGWDRTTIAQLIATKRTFDGAVEPTPAPPAEPTTHTTETTKGCPCCGARRFWKSIHGATICGTCHPPAADSLVSEWLDGGPPDAL